MTHLHEQSKPHGTTVSDLRTLLSQDHARLDQLFDRLLAAFHADDREEAAVLWNAFETGLEAHMVLEEQRILPEFAKVDSAEAAQLAREHVAIRSSLAELGVAMDLHQTKAAAIDRLVGDLREHAKREDALMYRWASSNLSGDVETSVRSQLLAALRKLASTV
jgi:hypothetical protein